MKRIFLLIILASVVAMILSVCSCERHQAPDEVGLPIDDEIQSGDSISGDSFSSEDNVQNNPSQSGNGSSNEDHIQDNGSQSGNGSSNGNHVQDNTSPDGDNLQGDDALWDDVSWGDVSWDDINCITVGCGMDSPIPPYAISCKIPKEYSLADANIPIMLSFGLIDGSYIDTDSYTHIMLKVEKGRGQSFVIKKINIQEIMDSEYNVRIVWDENHEWAVDFDYTHTEIIGLPRSLFTGESGRIHIAMMEYSSTDTGEIKIGNIAYLFFDYMSDGTNISISVKDH